MIKAPPEGKVLVLLLVPAVMVMGNAALVPALPSMRQDLGLSPGEAALVITAFSGVAGLALPLAGPMSDRLGRSRVLILALIIFGVGATVSASAPLFGPMAWPVLLAGRGLQGLGAAGTQPVAWALAGDLYGGSRRESMLGYMESANGISKVASPVVGGLISAHSWPLLFITFTAVSWAVAGLALATLPSRIRGAHPQVIPRVRDLLPVAPLVLGALPVFMALFGLLAYLSEILESRHLLTGAAKGLALSLPMMASALASLMVGLVMAPLGHPLVGTMLTFMALEASGFLLLAFLMGSPWAVLGLITVGLGNGGTLPPLNMLVTSSVPKAKRGAATAFYGTVRFTGVAAGPPLFMLAWARWGEIWALAGIGILVAAGALMILAASRPGGPAAAS